MKNNKFTTSNLVFNLGDDGIIRSHYLEGAKETLETAKENNEALLKIIKQKELVLFIDATNLKAMNREARQYYAKEVDNKILKAIGLVVNSLTSRIIVDFVVGISKYPIKIFDSEDQAIDWLKKFVK